MSEHTSIVEVKYKGRIDYVTLKGDITHVEIIVQAMSMNVAIATVQHRFATGYKDVKETLLFQVHKEQY